MTIVNETIMVRLRLREIAEAKGFTMSSLSRESKLTLNQVRRYWYNSANGLQGGPPLTEVSLIALDTMANILGVEPRDLIDRAEESELRP